MIPAALSIFHFPCASPMLVRPARQDDAMLDASYLFLWYVGL